MFNQATRGSRGLDRARYEWAETGFSRNSTVSVRENAERLEVWEDEGGSNARPASEVLRVLIVDNDMAAADALELLLHANGFQETRVAYSAQGAKAIARDFRPSVVLIELDLRDMGSYELGQLLRERAQLQRIRLIAVTDSREQGGRDFARNAGFERYLFKPIVTGDIASLMTPGGV
jgi:PleD family two-component response regulator